MILEKIKSNTFNKNKYITPENFKFTLNNQEYTAIFDTAVVEDNDCIIENRTYIMHEDKLVGYLRHHFIPNDSLKQYLSTPFDFLVLKKYKSYNIFSKVPDYEKIFLSMSLENKIDNLKNLCHSLHMNNYYHELSNQDIDEEKFNFYLQEIKEKINKHYAFKSEYKKFKLQYTSKSFIDFSHTRDEGDKMKLSKITPKLEQYAKEMNIDIEKLFIESDKSYQRKGLGVMMYTLTADWLYLNKMNLFSGLLNDKSKKLWIEKFPKENIKIIETSENHYTLDRSDIDLNYLYRKNNIVKNKKSR